MKYTLIEFPDDSSPTVSDIDQVLSSDGGEHSHVAVVHSETTSGIINDVETIGQVLA